MLCNGCVNHLLREHCKYLNIFLRILVAYIQPELIEGVRRCVICIQPDISLLCLATLLAVCLGYERAGKSVGLAAQLPADKLGAGSNITPLVAAAHLKFAVHLLIKMEEIISLHKLVGELGKGHTLSALIIETLLYRVLAHHIIYGNMLSYISDKLQEREVLHPIIIVHKQSGIRLAGIKIQKLCQLGLNSLLVMPQSLLIQEFALLTLHRRVANHTGCSAHKRNRLMPAGLKMLKHHNTHQVTYMQRIRSRVNPHISRCALLHKLLLRPRHNSVDHTSPLKFLNKILHLYIINK